MDRPLEPFCVYRNHGDVRVVFLHFDSVSCRDLEGLGSKDVLRYGALDRGHYRRRKEFLAVRKVLYLCGIFSDALMYTSKGKPFLSGKKRACLSISHSKNWVAVGFAPYDLGLDLQEFSPNMDRVYSRITSPGERCKFPRTRDHIHWMWSMKEACFKAKGFGLMTDFTLDFWNETGQFALFSSVSSGERYRAYCFRLYDIFYSWSKKVSF